MRADRAQWDAFAEIYDEESISPFRRGVRFPLSRDVEHALRPWKRERSIRERVGIDFGCGPGDSLRVLAGHIGLAIGVDFSPKMLSVCRQRFRLKRTRGSARSLIDTHDPSTAPKTRVAIGDLTNLEDLRDSVDLAVSVNAVCPSNARHARQMLSEMLRSVRPGGTAIVVVPAAEATESLFRVARREGIDLSELGRFDRRRSVLTYSTGEAQRYLRRDEIEAVTERCGISTFRLERVEYPWTHMREAGWGYFPTEPRLWDWYLVAERAPDGR